MLGQTYGTVTMRVSPMSWEKKFGPLVDRIGVGCSLESELVAGRTTMQHFSRGKCQASATAGCVVQSPEFSLVTPRSDSCVLLNHPLKSNVSPGDRPHRMWSAHEWKVYLDSEDGIRQAIADVARNPEDEGKSPQSWRFVSPFAEINTAGWTTCH